MAEFHRLNSIWGERQWPTPVVCRRLRSSMQFWPRKSIVTLAASATLHDGAPTAFLVLRSAPSWFENGVGARLFAATNDCPTTLWPTNANASLGWKAPGAADRPGVWTKVSTLWKRTITFWKSSRKSGQRE